MKLFNKAVVVFFTFLGVNQLFAAGKLELVNSQTVNINSIETLNITYSEDNSVLLESNDENITIKEFMVKNNPGYYSKIENTANNLNITGGERPRLWKSVRIEVYIPKTFTQNLSVAVESGGLMANYHMQYRNINLSVLSGELILNKISSETTLINVSSGHIKIDELLGLEHTLRNLSGNITVNNLQGKINISNESGEVVINGLDGEGNINVDSGNIVLTINNIIGNLSLFTDSGNIDLTINKNISFVLDAELESGNITAPNGIRLERNNDKIKYNFGTNPRYTLFAKCDSGNIRIREK